MNSIQKNMPTSSLFIPLILSVVFFSFGNWGFLNIFDIRREVQAVLIFLLFISALETKLNFRFIKNPLFIYVVSFLLSEIILRQRETFIYDSILSVFILVILSSFSGKYISKSISSTISVAAIFASIFILQAIILILDQDLLAKVDFPYSSETGSSGIKISHPIQYLGFGSPGGITFFGWKFVRLSGYASEPSVLVSSMLTIGLLGLTFKGIFRYLSLLILFFSIVLAGSGTIFLSLAFGVISIFIFKAFRKFTWIVAIIPFLIIGVTGTVLVNYGADTFAVQFLDLMQPLEETSSLFSKHASAPVRMFSQIEALSSFRFSIIGTSSTDPYLTGLLFNSFHFAGVVGGLAISFFLYHLFRYSHIAACNHKGLVSLSCAFLYGTITQAMLFSGYGWASVVGVMALFFTYRRLCTLSTSNYASDMGGRPGNSDRAQHQ